MPFRAFISADLGAFPRIEAFAQALRESGGQLKLVDLDLLHTTLKFLGDTDEALAPEIVRAMETAVQGVAPVHATLHGTGVFPNPNRISVVWVGLVGADALAGVAATLNAALPVLGFPPENRRWLPHVTVARVKGGRNLDRVRAAVQVFADEAFGESTVDRIRLKRSVLRPEGPEYTTIADVALPG